MNNENVIICELNRSLVNVNDLINDINYCDMSFFKSISIAQCFLSMEKIDPLEELKKNGKIIKSTSLPPGFEKNIKTKLLQEKWDINKLIKMIDPTILEKLKLEFMKNKNNFMNLQKPATVDAITDLCIKLNINLAIYEIKRNLSKDKISNNNITLENMIFNINMNTRIPKISIAYWDKDPEHNREAFTLILSKTTHSDSLDNILCPINFTVNNYTLNNKYDSMMNTALSVYDDVFSIQTHSEIIMDRLNEKKNKLISSIQIKKEYIKCLINKSIELNHLIKSLSGLISIEQSLKNFKNEDNKDLYIFNNKYEEIQKILIDTDNKIQKQQFINNTKKNNLLSLNKYISNLKN